MHSYCNENNTDPISLVVRQSGHSFLAIAGGSVGSDPGGGVEGV
ncbi:hypothetical protein RE6C_05347 [Rhodopirellula europaea 6C]|uniref:Uncharacterized protein n=1 Tax=Rhodopirellula europaea 6C TaxID=1263867 RepID=M2ABC6_9BACT|nr:hypothetical protein RE6C_05347 [Rhodopirellula europaea 6C]